MSRLMRIGTAAIFAALACFMLAFVLLAPTHKAKAATTQPTAELNAMQHEIPHGPAGMSLLGVGVLGTMIGGQFMGIGRMVHFVMPDGKHRPATVVEDWGGGLHVNLQVFTDGTNDGADTPLTLWETSVEYSESPQPRTWHWPERVGLKEAKADSTVAAVA